MQELIINMWIFLQNIHFQEFINKYLISILNL